MSEDVVGKCSFFSLAVPCVLEAPFSCLSDPLSLYQNLVLHGSFRFFTLTRLWQELFSAQVDSHVIGFCLANQHLKSTTKKIKSPQTFEFHQKCVCHVWQSYSLVILTIKWTNLYINLSVWCVFHALLSLHTMCAKDHRLLILKRLSVLMLCAPVFIFTSGSSALLGCPRCSLSIWLSLLAIFNTLFWVYVSFCTRKWTKHKILEVCYFRVIRQWPLTVTRRAKH